MSKSKAFKRLTIAIPSEIYAILEGVATQEQRSVTNFVSYTIVRYIKSKEQKNNA